MANDLEKMVIDDETIVKMAEMWYDENSDVFDESGIDPEDGWSGDPPEELDTIAEDAAADMIDQLRNPEDRSGGIVVVNPLDDVVNGLYFAFAEMTAATPEDYEAWLETLEDEEEEPDQDEIADEVEGDEEVDQE
jgi:hypothetical protein